MKKILFLLLCLPLFACNATQQIKDTPLPKEQKKTVNTAETFEGFFDFSWDVKSGKILLTIDRLEEEFLYVNSLPAGVGSNDIGLDRGQIGENRVVKFIRSGPKILLVHVNYSFRAISDNEAEKKSIEQAFAQSVLWGFKIESENGTSIKVDATKFLSRDAHDVIGALKRSKQGNYKLDPSRSAIFMDRTKNFPDNTEFEATLTFTGEPKGRYVNQVVPSPKAITVRQHHSFIRLPDSNYQMRELDPRSGFFGIQFQDYATPIDQPLMKRYIQRHRLQKKDPTAKVSEAVEPIIYYVDPGAPEPIRSALITGASWWNQAFEAAGYKDAFQVKVLPEDVDPMDVRYNVIQWVHRATRGWSYGTTVFDPRTGEIIKGHVSLGSLRVRQDYLIAQGLLKEPFKNERSVSPKMKEMALARLRQLSAHEIGHTLGLLHNFAASTNDRASVMDYPHPYIQLDKNGGIDFSNAYDDKIGEWDKRTIIYGYQDFPKGTNEKEGLKKIIETSIAQGFRYVSDRDARPNGGAHPSAHLWDNGNDAIDEMDRLMNVRQQALKNFSEYNIRENAAMSTLEEVLVPLYLSHRYQTEAVVKLIGGVDYNYAMRGDQQGVVKIIPAATQQKAIQTILKTLAPEQLALPENLLALIPPKPPSYRRGRESFKTRTGLTFDPIAAAESAANTSIRLLLHPQRAARLVEHQVRFPKGMPGLGTVIDQLFQTTWKDKKDNVYHAEIQRMAGKLALQNLMRLQANDKTASQVRAIALLKINELEKWIQANLNTNDELQKAHYVFALAEIEKLRLHPESIKLPQAVAMPDGSPIGMEWSCGHDCLED